MILRLCGCQTALVEQALPLRRTTPGSTPRHISRHPALACCSHGSQGSPHSSVSNSRRQLLGALAAAAAAALQFGGRLSPALAIEPLTLDDGKTEVEPAEADPSAAAASPASRQQQGSDSPGSAVKYQTLYNKTLAYTFDYPVTTADGKKLPLVFSRPPERYSSAAPLTADARQRIVGELIDLIDGITVSVSVGPPSPLLRGREPGEWQPREVAEAVLIDRSTMRVSSGQRVAMQTVERVVPEQRDQLTYLVYEHISQGSPNLRNPTSKETYRRSLSATAWRPGEDGTPYLYTLNLSCPDEAWPELQPLFRHAIDTFRLLPPGQGYVAPDRDPWRFF